METTDAVKSALSVYTSDSPPSVDAGKLSLNVKVHGPVNANSSATTQASRLLIWRDYQDRAFDIASGIIHLHSVSVINTNGTQDLYMKFYDNPFPDIASDPVRWTLHVPEGSTVNITNDLMPYLTFGVSLSFACVITTADSDITEPDVAPLVQFQYIVNP